MTDLSICYFNLFRFILQYDLPENSIKQKLVAFGVLSIIQIGYGECDMQAVGGGDGAKESKEKRRLGVETLIPDQTKECDSCSQGFGLVSA